MRGAGCGAQHLQLPVQDVAERPALSWPWVAAVGLNVWASVCCSHSDITVPDFSHYHGADVLVPRLQTRAQSVESASPMPVTYTAKNVVPQLVSSMSASADMLATSKIKVKVFDIPEGRHMPFR